MRREDRTLGAAKARAVSSALRLTSPLLASIETIAYLRGAIVVERKMDGALARLVKTNDKALIAVSLGLAGGRRRFAIAHELGHLELHDGQETLALCTVDDFHPRDHSREGEANAFAVELLLPQRLIEPRCDVKAPSLEHAQQIAASFEVSLVAAALRFVELTPEACALVVCENGRVSWSVPNQDFGPAPKRGVELQPASLAYEVFAGRELPDAPEDVPAYAWPGVRRHQELVEHSVMWGATRTLTLLWRPVC